MESDWIDMPSRRFGGCTEKACPRCGCKSYYDCTPKVAWCWASGLIGIGDALPPVDPQGGAAIEIAHGPKYALKAQIQAVARHGKGAGAGQLLVPGVPEAESQKDKCNALAAWLAWCGKSTWIKKNRDGVKFAKEVA